MIHVSVNGKSGQFKEGVNVLTAVSQIDPLFSESVLGFFFGGRVLELNESLTEDCALVPITFRHEEGRRIYERSLRFVMLLALRRLFPHSHVRIEHSLGYGVYVNILDRQLTEADISKIEAEMRSIVAQNLPFEKEKWSREKAIDYFNAEGETDKTRLLAYRPYDYFYVYFCGGMAEYFYGAMLPGTGYVKAFALNANPPGFILRMPSPKNPDIPAPAVDFPKHLHAFEQSNYWCRVLHCVNAADLNDLIIKDRLRDFIRVNEALHDKSIAEIAEEIKRRGSRAVFIAGPSSSGKTTFAHRLSIHLRVLGLSPVPISLDDFYRDKSTLPLEKNGKPDLEALSALDVPLIKKCLGDLLSGKETVLPRFDFKTQRREKIGHSIRINDDQPLIIEGIHGLNPELSSGFPRELLFRVFITELTCLNLDDHNRIRTTDARLLRRIVRDYQFRNTLPNETMSMWNSVRRGEEKWIFPFQEQADYVFNSALHYELPVLKNIAYELLKVITPDNPNYLLSRRLLKILHYLLPAPADVLNEIPPLSLLREFIGGCTLYD